MTSRSDLLDEGTDSHYRDAAYYDHAYKRRKNDVAFYAALAEKHGGPVLELGVGTGRVAREIAGRGIDVVGVDRMPSMLARARQNLEKARAGASGNVVLRVGDVRALRLRKRFPLVIAPFNVLMHLYGRRDVERALASVRAHLAPGARFAFDVLLPNPTVMARDPERVFRCGHVRIPNGARCRYDESFVYDAASQIEHVTMFFQPLEPKGRPFIQRLAHRYFFPRELEALLHYNGFTVESFEGGFDGEPLDDVADSQVIVARARGGHSRKRTSQ